MHAFLQKVAVLMVVTVVAGSVPADALAADPAAAPRVAQVIVAAVPDSAEVPTVNLNTASTAELMYLPGIGLKKAEAIVARRDRRKFARPEDIMEVKGIGRGIYKRLKPYLRVSGTTTADRKIPAARGNA